MIPRVGEYFKEKSLGHHLDENLSWVYHAEHVHKKLVSANFALSRSKSFLPQKVLQQIYRSLFESHLHFGSTVWGCAKPRLLHKLEVQQKKAIRHIKHLRYNAHTGDHFRKLQYLTVRDLISFDQAIFLRKYSNNKLPSSFNNMLCPVPDQGARRTRDDDYNFHPSSLSYADLHYFPTPQLIYNWNNLPLLVKSVSDMSDFRSDLKHHFVSKYETNCLDVNCYSCHKNN